MPRSLSGSPRRRRFVVVMVVCRIGAVPPVRRLFFVPSEPSGASDISYMETATGDWPVLIRCPACNNEARPAFQIPWLAAFYLCPSCGHACSDATARDPSAEQGQTAERLRRVVVYAMRTLHRKKQRALRNAPAPSEPS
jgi:hypothetical protein